MKETLPSPWKCWGQEASLLTPDLRFLCCLKGILNTKSSLDRPGEPIVEEDGVRARDTVLPECGHLLPTVGDFLWSPAFPSQEWSLLLVSYSFMPCESQSFHSFTPSGKVSHALGVGGKSVISFIRAFQESWGESVILSSLRQHPERLLRGNWKFPWGVTV